MSDNKHSLSNKAMQYRNQMWQVTPYNKQGKRLSQNIFLNKLICYAKKAELSWIGALIYCDEMCKKHGYPTNI